jgi:First Longin domain of INTU, CCZ1 and HPS4
LVRFFIFNSSFGPREGEEAKRIIFYHSDSGEEEEEEQKVKQVI